MVIQMDYIRHAGIVNWNESRAHVDVNLNPPRAGEEF